MRIAITSDWHGYIPPEIPDCDLLLVAGDIGLNERFGYDPLPLLTDWWTWIKALPMPVIAVAGNHDFHPEVLRALPWTYLEDESVHINGVTIWGTPWSNPFAHGWAFNMTEEDQVENLKGCPDGVDIIVSHGPPFGYRDMTPGWKHAGSKALLDRMEQLPFLQLVACGHLHSGYGVEKTPSGITVVGGSLVDEEYEVANPPIVVNL